jgi:hypothetical protein
VDVGVDPDPPVDTEWSPQRARYRLMGGHHIDIQRDPLHVELVLCKPTATECVVQPHLTSAASTIGSWLGRQTLHAGAFLHEGGVWGLLGEKGLGKSSTLGWLARAGAAIVADDLMVWDHGMVLAGPRGVDLRPEPARRLGIGRDLGVVGTRERWRVDLSPCPPESPLRGWIFLDWGPEARVDRLGAAERLARLTKHRALSMPWTDPEALLELASRPALLWQRPHGWDEFDAAIDGLLAGLESQ